MLADRPVHPEYKNNYTPLHFAAAAGDLRTVMVLLQHTEFDINATDNEGNTALHEAVKEREVKEKEVEINVEDRINVIKYLLTCENINPTIKNKMGQTLLYFAAESGEVGMLEVLLKQPAIANLLSNQDESGNTPLHAAVEKNHAEAVKLILVKMKEKNINPNTKNTHGETPMHIGAANKHIATMKSLLECPEIKLDEKDKDDNTPLHAALMRFYRPCSYWLEKNQYVEPVRLLLDYMRQKNIDLNLKNNSDRTPLHITFGNSNMDVLKVFLEYENVDPNIICDEKTGNTLLHKVVEKYVDINTQVHRDITDSKTVSEFNESAKKKLEEQREVVELLLGHKKINPNVINKRGETPLYWVCTYRLYDSETPKFKRQQTDMASMLMAHKDINPNLIVNDENLGEVTVLDRLIRRGSLDDIEFFLTSKNLNLARQTPFGPTAFHDVAARGRAEVCALLRQRDADINAIDNNHDTPLHVAVRCQNPKMVTTLLSYGANKDAVNSDSNTPLHVAALAENKKIIEALLASGADPTIRNKEGKTAAQTVLRNDEIVEILEEEERQFAAQRKKKEGKMASSISIPLALFGGSTTSGPSSNTINKSIDSSNTDRSTTSQAILEVEVSKIDRSPSSPR